MELISFVPIAGVVSGLIAILLFFLLIKRLRNRKKKILVCIIHFLIVVIFALISSIFVLLYVSLKGYQHFTYNKPIFSIECPIREDDSFVVKFIPLDGEESQARFYRVKGQQFVIEGHIVRWENFFVTVGMKPLYQVTRLTGRYVSINDEKEKERSVYEIAEETRVWRWLMQYGEKIPGIDAVHGISSFKDAVEHKNFTVYITHNSFIIKEK
ncbi:hypothetical protein JW879_00630 [candidate division WOR-3 bacterium]|nr:hypothetical protein [candidate division WOR-3 bacterium]